MQSKAQGVWTLLPSSGWTPKKIELFGGLHLFSGGFIFPLRI